MVEQVRLYQKVMGSNPADSGGAFYWNKPQKLLPSRFTISVMLAMLY